MTREQRRERDHWLDVAEQFATGRSAYMGLCWHALDLDAQVGGGRPFARLKWFKPTREVAFWWDVAVRGNPDANRTLVACFLAAMAELGE